MVNITEVCANNRGLVYTIAKRYLPACERDRAVSLDDLAQAGYIGLIEAAQTYDEAKGAFSTWAGMYIRKEMRAALGLHSLKPKAERDALSLDAEIGEDITLADTLTAPDDTEEHIDRSELVRRFEQSGYAFEVSTNTGSQKAPIVAALEGLRRDVLAYAVQLGLTPSGLKKINDASMKPERRSILAEALKELGG